MFRLCQTVPDGFRALLLVGGSPFDSAGLGSTDGFRMACKRSGVRIPIAPLSQVFPGQSLTDRLLRICAQDSCGPDRGSGCGICAGHGHLELLRPSLAYPASEPGHATVSGFRCFLQFRHGVKGWGPLLAASSPVRAGATEGVRRDHPGGSPTLPCTSCRCRSGGFRPGWLICPALAGAAFWGPAFPGVPRRWRRAAGGGTLLSVVAAPAGVCGSSDRARGGFPGIPRQLVTNQVTALSGLVAARVSMTAGGIACRCADGPSCASEN